MAELLKDKYTRAYIENLAHAMKEAYQDFALQEFIDAVFDGMWEEFTLKQRMRHIATMLHRFLPFSYVKQLAILKSVSAKFTSFEAMFFQDFVELYGLDDFEASMEALAVFTIGSSSEFAIRQFILQDEAKTMAQMHLWAQSENHELRRLASEGCRPRLPWGVALESFKKDPSRVLELLERLKNDTSLYVRKSVANNLNDISKDHPQVTRDFVAKNLGHSKELDWICKHAARTLLKKGDVATLQLFGLHAMDDVKLSDFKHDVSLKRGENLCFSFSLSAPLPLGMLRVEYAIYYLRANGSYSKKLFMLSQNEIQSVTKKFKKQQSFRDMSVRKHYAGEHFIALVINGEERIKSAFYLH